MLLLVDVAAGGALPSYECECIVLCLGKKEGKRCYTKKGFEGR